eukprot:Gregarina_sp_Pseudo_9__828@NODE_152_length_3952_cov_9_054434_g139_i0_p1_GENE_NODE_152_length_3952_cov_9_054434_g139_i0NODE_152_length_3952_cov_9_054434_g139_i0_p1_ORF_typecomplete_len473_score43_47PALP/PF00291_25/7_5e48Thr_synth_N/PF14821_6/1_4e17Pribosyltran/PF00156_27/5_1e02Pribosyltran/PF00156_27/0_55_NODE_152_length_3952_cov_9_054434_g139_i021993617
MLFQSTRASPETAPVGFEECILNGMAPDGGLYYPLSLPTLSSDLIAKWKAMRDSDELYQTMAFDVISLFAGDSLPTDVLQSAIETAAASFRLPNWTQLKEIPNENGMLRLLELFHGPTYSFKDYSIMLLGGLINYFLRKRNQIGTALVATSGDTGSAAIAGLCKQSHARIAVLLPKGRVSNVQQRMMTTVQSDRVKCLLVEGNFDDCQRLLKEAFADQSFAKEMQLMAVNSVNFGRIVCQMVYYFWATMVWQPPNHPRTVVCVPTGNFGNVLAAWYARRMGAPIDKLLIASNRNDILPRFYQTGEYKLVPVVPTITPSIDIALSSNFERLVQYYNRDTTKKFYDRLALEGAFGVDANCHNLFKEEFGAYSVSEDETLETMSKYWNEKKYLIDPHTAVGLRVAEEFCQSSGAHNILIVSTAHPAKFPEAVENAVGEGALKIPENIVQLLNKPEIATVIAPTLEAVKASLREAF